MGLVATDGRRQFSPRATRPKRNVWVEFSGWLPASSLRLPWRPFVLIFSCVGVVPTSRAWWTTSRNWARLLLPRSRASGDHDAVTNAGELLGSWWGRLAAFGRSVKPS